MRSTIRSAVVVAMVAGMLAGGSEAVASPFATCPAGHVALTFDDGPIPGRTDRVLDALDGAPATFFVNGSKVDAAPATARRIQAEGHVLANHTYDHAWLTRYPDDAIRSQILRTVSAAEDAGVEMAPLVRPPFGATNARVRAIFAELGVAQVMWTVDPWDWRGYAAATLARHVLSQLRDGAIVIFHDGSPASQVADALPGILSGMAARGFCPGLLDAEALVVPPFDPASLPPDPGPACVGPGPCDTVGVASSGRWTIREFPGWGAAEQTFSFGDDGDLPLVGDWDGDGDDDPGVYRAPLQTVHLRQDDGSVLEYMLGDPGDVPLVGDWDGDGRDTVSIYRPSTQVFHVFDAHGGAAGRSFVFGDPGDRPFAGDLDGDGIDEVGLHRATTGRVYFRETLDTGIADHDFVFGNPGDVLLAGDWDGDGTDTLAVYRPSIGVWYLKLTNGSGIADHVFWFTDSGRAYPLVVRRSVA